MYSSFSPVNSFAGYAYTQGLVLSNLTIQNSITPFTIIQGSKEIFSMAPGEIIVDGNFTVTGTLLTNQTIINTYNSGMIHLADNNPADIVDIGIYGEYVNGGTVYTGIVRDSNSPLRMWTVFNNVTTPPGNTIIFGQPIPDSDLDNIKAKALYLPTTSAGSVSIGFTTALTTGFRYSGSSINTVWNGTDIITVTDTLISAVPRILTSSAADSASSADVTASIVTAGGISAAKTINCLALGTGNLTATGSATLGTAFIGTLTTGAFTCNSLTISSTLNVPTVNASTITVSSTLSVPTLTCTTGNIGNVNASNVMATGGITSSADVMFTKNVACGTTAADVLSATTLNVFNNLTTAPGSATIIQGTLSVNSITTTGNVVAPKLRSTSLSNSTTSADTNASLVSSGGASIALNTNIGGNVTIGGNLVVAGSSSSASSSLLLTAVFAGNTITLDLLQDLIEFTLAGVINITLPPLNNTYYGKQYILVFVGVPAVANILPSGGDLIEGAANASITVGVPYLVTHVVAGQLCWYTS